MYAEATSPSIRANWLPRAIICGFNGAVVMMLTFVVAYSTAYVLGAARPREDGTLTTMVAGWFWALTHNTLTDLAGTNVYVVAGLHFLIAMIWATLYAHFAEPRLAGPGWLRGAAFSLIPWLISILVLLPLAGGGPLGLALGAGPLPLLGNLVLHLAYGVTLGALYGPLGDLPADSFSAAGARDDLETSWHSERETAMGIVAGLMVGLLASLALAELSGAGPGSQILGIPQGAFVFGTTILGGSLGAFIGSFTGLGSRDSTVSALAPPRQRPVRH